MALGLPSLVVLLERRKGGPVTDTLAVFALWKNLSHDPLAPTTGVVSKMSSSDLFFRFFRLDYLYHCPLLDSSLIRLDSRLAASFEADK
jgi:hypothetical protein